MSVVTSDTITNRLRDSSANMLLSILNQSPDCIKILDLDGRLQYMNQNGLCAMEIENFDTVDGVHWPDLWPHESRTIVEDALIRAGGGEMVHFRSICPTANGKERWWDVSLNAYESEAGIKGFIAISRDVTLEVEDQDAAEAMAREMRHRLGNAYQIVGSLISSFARGDAEKEQFAEDMVGRMKAMSATQTMRAADGATVAFTDLVEKVLRPFETPEAPMNIGEVPPLRLEQRETDALALVLGELCVNSMKHGALGNGGSIDVRGDIKGSIPRLVWAEHTKRPIGSHSRNGGKGLKLIAWMMTARGGGIDVVWKDDGLEMVITLRAREDQPADIALISAQDAQ